MSAAPGGRTAVEADLAEQLVSFAREFVAGLEAQGRLVEAGGASALEHLRARVEARRDGPESYRDAVRTIVEDCGYPGDVALRIATALNRRGLLPAGTEPEPRHDRVPALAPLVPGSRGAIVLRLAERGAGRSADGPGDAPAEEDGREHAGVPLPGDEPLAGGRGADGPADDGASGEEGGTGAGSAAGAGGPAPGADGAEVGREPAGGGEAARPDPEGGAEHAGPEHEVPDQEGRGPEPAGRNAPGAVTERPGPEPSETAAERRAARDGGSARGLPSAPQPGQGCTLGVASARENAHGRSIGAALGGGAVRPPGPGAVPAGEPVPERVVGQIPRVRPATVRSRTAGWDTASARAVSLAATLQADHLARLEVMRITADGERVTVAVKPTCLADWEYWLDAIGAERNVRTRTAGRAQVAAGNLDGVAVHLTAHGVPRLLQEASDAAAEPFYLWGRIYDLGMGQTDRSDRVWQCLGRCEDERGMPLLVLRGTSGPPYPLAAIVMAHGPLTATPLPGGDARADAEGGDGRADGRTGP
ncbi:BN159_2729 family protein [Streptomyces sp. NPDC048566]|uniref:BN159_2729 family protein n=1 Tax=Streptomyces sp. NPDC048566 TaxID=3365569 RepID=UPI003710573F